MPEKVDIPDRYIPDSDDELSLEEKQFHAEKAQKLKKLLAAQRLVMPPMFWAVFPHLAREGLNKKVYHW